MGDALYSFCYVGAVDKANVLAEGDVGVMTHVPRPWYALWIVRELWHRFDAFDCYILPLFVWPRDTEHVLIVDRSDNEIVTVAR